MALGGGHDEPLDAVAQQCELDEQADARRGRDAFDRGVGPLGQVEFVEHGRDSVAAGVASGEGEFLADDAAHGHDGEGLGDGRCVDEGDRPADAGRVLDTVDEQAAGVGLHPAAGDE
ncbi:hypothetical protein DEI92_03055 [Curtobacterium sp. MCBD17_034]|nr:hypothetical protein DEI92_03055 [Curtobacterium sp. MCBD17_034]PZM39819.1 hypothetical protein DEI90_03050 [Curtobacterium sp. MCBD17_031]